MKINVVANASYRTRDNMAKRKAKKSGKKRKNSQWAGMTKAERRVEVKRRTSGKKSLSKANKSTKKRTTKRKNAKRKSTKSGRTRKNSQWTGMTKTERRAEVKRRTSGKKSLSRANKGKTTKRKKSRKNTGVKRFQMFRVPKTGRTGLVRGAEYVGGGALGVGESFGVYALTNRFTSENFKASKFYPAVRTGALAILPIGNAISVNFIKNKDAKRVQLGATISTGAIALASLIFGAKQTWNRIQRDKKSMESENKTAEQNEIDFVDFMLTQGQLEDSEMVEMRASPFGNSNEGVLHFPKTMGERTLSHFLSMIGISTTIDAVKAKSEVPTGTQVPENAAGYW